MRRSIGAAIFPPRPRRNIAESRPGGDLTGFVDFHLREVVHAGPSRELNRPCHPIGLQVSSLHGVPPFTRAEQTGSGFSETLGLQGCFLDRADVLVVVSQVVDLGPLHRQSVPHGAETFSADRE